MHENHGEGSFGLETHQVSIIKYCQDNGLDLVAIYEDPAISGSFDPLSRPGMTAALNALYAGGIERLVVYKLDRLARDLYLTLWLEKEAKKFWAEVLIITEP